MSMTRHSALIPGELNMRKHKHLPLSQKIQLRVSRPRVGSSVFLLGTKGWHYEGQVDPAPLGRGGGLEKEQIQLLCGS